MLAKIDHVAIRVNDLEESVRFFQEVFEMNIDKTAGEKPMRKIWFREGIQLNETEGIPGGEGEMDHIGICCDHKEIILERSRLFGCSPLPNGDHWFQTPDGVKIELKEADEK